MTRCRACGAPIRYEDRRRRFPLEWATWTIWGDWNGMNWGAWIGHVCLSRRVRLPRVREQRKGRA